MTSPLGASFSPAAIPGGSWGFSHGMLWTAVMQATFLKQKESKPSFLLLSVKIKPSAPGKSSWDPSTSLQANCRNLPGALLWILEDILGCPLPLLRSSSPPWMCRSVECPTSECREPCVWAYIRPKQISILSYRPVYSSLSLCSYLIFTVHGIF